MLILNYPVQAVMITSRFGPRPMGQHYGIDFRAFEGTPILAAASGKVVESRLSMNDPADWKAGDPAPRVMGWGHRIAIDHGGGYVTSYNHLSSRSVQVGAYVDAGRQIGAAGNTGYSFGAHLHFELRLMGKPVDPMPLFKPEGCTCPSPGFVVSHECSVHSQLK